MLPYRMAIGAARLIAPLFARGDSKLARGITGRRGAVEVLEGWGRGLRDPGRPVAWFHAPSVGEGFQAAAVIEALRERLPDVQVVYTFFSPSAEGLARRVGADVATYLPWDLRGPIRRTLEAIRPDVVVFTKTEIWPTLVAEARARRIPTAIVGATVPEGAGRARWPARALLRGSWSSLSLGAANSQPDADRLRYLGVPADVVHVCGDPGIDSAAARYDARDRASSWLRAVGRAEGPTVVAGSTWPADEQVLLPAIRAVREEAPDVRLVIAPHEPSAEVVAGLGRTLRDAGWTVATLAELEAGADETERVNAVVVERVGVLADLYEKADVSFVGGGFHDAGLHSVLEPAAAASPVVFGPRHANARAAGELVELGGAKVASDVASLGRIVAAWLGNEPARRAAGDAAERYIEGHRGAAGRTADLLTHLVRQNR